MGDADSNIITINTVPDEKYEMLLAGNTSLSN